MKVPTHDIKDAFEDLIEHFEPIVVRYSLHGEEVLCLPESLDIYFWMFEIFQPVIKNVH